MWPGGIVNPRVTRGLHTGAEMLIFTASISHPKKMKTPEGQDESDGKDEARRRDSKAAHMQEDIYLT